jgi:hypothetical protein
MANDPKRVPVYLRAKRAWVVIDKEGVVRFTKISESRDLLPNDELLKVLSALK